MFGRRKGRKDADVELADAVDEAAQAEQDEAAELAGDGPRELDEAIDTPEVLGERIDLGSVVVPAPPGGQLQVELAPDGSVQGVHLMVPEIGRITVAAYAAPKSSGQWREVVTEIADSLREGDAQEVTIETGPWGREIYARTPGADLRFIGVEGPRWMIRLVAVAASGSGAAATDAPLITAAREILRNTLVRRGDEPHPVRTPLPVALPPLLAEQLAAAHQQQIAENSSVGQDQERPVRQGAAGSAMQQLNRQND